MAKEVKKRKELTVTNYINTKDGGYVNWDTLTPEQQRMCRNALNRQAFSGPQYREITREEAALMG